MSFGDDDLDNEFGGRRGGVQDQYDDSGSTRPRRQSRGFSEDDLDGDGPDPYDQPNRGESGPLTKVREFFQDNPIILIGIVVVAVGALGYFIFFGGDSEADPKGDVSTVEEEVVGQSNSGAFDPNDPDGTVKDNRDGDTSSAVMAIRGYLYSYYIDRNAEEAADYYASSGDVSAEKIQQNIDNTIEDVKYNVAITPTGTNEYNVVLTLILPDGRSRDFNQTYIMAKENSQFYIESFVSTQ